jgi:hypothetical protein
MRPVKAKIDMRRPALPADKLKACMRMGMTGGTLNWARGAATLNSTRIESTNQLEPVLELALI